jgi:hypothetical protein
MEPETEKKTRDPAAPRKRRATSIYDRDGNEVLISLMCLKCRTVKPLAQFGLRKMADGAIRNQPWCRSCRSGASAHKVKKGADLTAELPIETVPEVLATSPQIVPIELDVPLAAEAMEMASMGAPSGAEAGSNVASEASSQPGSDAQREDSPAPAEGESPQ